MRNPRPGTERETVSRPALAWGDRAADRVCWGINADPKRRTYQCNHRRTLAEIEKKIIKMGKRNAVSRLLHAKNDKEAIETWRRDLNRVLLIFNVSTLSTVFDLLTVSFQTKLGIDTRTLVVDMYRNMANQGRANVQHSASVISALRLSTIEC